MRHGRVRASRANAVGACANRTSPYCAPASDCGPGQYESIAADALRDRTCATCVTDTCAQATYCSDCMDLDGIDPNAVFDNDSGCEWLCATGFYCNATAGCAPLSPECDYAGGYYEHGPPGDWSDRVCAQLTASSCSYHFIPAHLRTDEAGGSGFRTHQIKSDPVKFNRSKQPCLIPFLTQPATRPLNKLPDQRATDCHCPPKDIGSGCRYASLSPKVCPLPPATSCSIYLGSWRLWLAVAC